MNRKRLAPITAAPVILALSGSIAPPASATFHFIQVQQVIGGVLGDTSAQAIQLRMRSAFQNQMQFARLRAWDAAGANPVLLIDMGTAVANDNLGDNVLIASASFPATTSPSAVADFILTNPIPASYLPAGSLTFEQSTGPAIGTVLWRLSWGGSAYTGPTTGSVTNDPDGDYGPPWPGPLPSAGTQALLFQGAAGDPSSSNDQDYALTPGAATFRNNAGDTFVIVDPTGVGLRAALLSDPRFVPNPFRSRTRLEFDLRKGARTTLIITDVSGRRVSRTEAFLPAGAHSLAWAAAGANGDPLPSGVYFYRLVAGMDVRSGRVVLVR